MLDPVHDYVFQNKTVAQLSYPEILKHSAETVESHRRGLVDIQPDHIAVDHAVFHKVSAFSEFPRVAVVQTGQTLVVSCGCRTPKTRLCKHQAEVLCNLIDRPELRIFFDATLRREKLVAFAKDYGLDTAENLDQFFEVEYSINRYTIKPIQKELVAMNEGQTELMQAALLAPKILPVADAPAPDSRQILVFRRHKYYHDQFHVELYEAKTAAAGKPKGPFTRIDPHFLTWNAEDIEAAKFYIAIARFEQTGGNRNLESNQEVLRTIARNPLRLETFVHNVANTDKISAATLEPVLLQVIPMQSRLLVQQKLPFYEVIAHLRIHGKDHPIQEIDLKFGHFIQLASTLNLVPDTSTLRIIDFFKQHNFKIVVHENKFSEFRQKILAPLEKQVEVQYPHIPVATKQQIQLQRFDVELEKIIYLSETGNFVSLTPVMRYGNVEVAIFSRQQIYDIDPRGNEFKVERDQKAETEFTALIMQEHPDFPEQLQEWDYFYLHKSKFLDEDWFLQAFEHWRANNITVLGFNSLKNNKLSMYKGSVNLLVSSDIDWFNVHIKVEYGNQTASLRQIKKSLKNKSKYVQLDDGRLGILPQEWMEKFAEYFQTGDVLDDLIRVPKSRFVQINELFEDEVIATETRSELHDYLEKFAEFKGIQEVAAPTELNATLRDYQRIGLSWLNFLDEYHFGGCLADDMGLGKTIQVLAFLLLQKKKFPGKTNLIVVPTSLLFNWQAEVAKFAPTLTMFTHHSANRIQEPTQISPYDIILTTYGMMQNEILLWRQCSFNYIILDESQAIKNPDSQRYKCARLLKSRNKLVLTGTPFENNSFDIFGQLSFACPGLLGSYDNFKFLYSNPIERFDDHRRAMALKKIISPFILRRTKKQVAQELPEKTEMVIYCEMGPEQRIVYDRTEKELRDYVLEIKRQKHKKGNEKDPVDTMYVLKGLMKLRQICDSPKLLKGEQVIESPSSKIDILLEQISQQSDDHKILVFSQFVEMLDLIHEALDAKGIRHEMLTGQTRDRAAKVHAFQNDAEVRVFLISLKAGGTGLNLTEADYVYIVDPWWNPAVENQAIDRSHRLGQQKHVVAVRLICPGTVEEKILQLQDAKNRMSDTLIQSDAEILRSLSKEDLLRMLQ